MVADLRPKYDPLKLAKLAAKAFAEASAKAAVEKRLIEQLLIGRRARVVDRAAMLISSVRITPHGGVLIYGKKRRDFRSEHLLGSLDVLEIVP